MPCTVKKTVATIVESGNDYCIGLKANQKTLLKQAQQCAQQQVPISPADVVRDTSHGRLVERRVEVFAAPAALFSTWPGLAAFVRVERSGLRDNHAFIRESWFIVSRVISAQQAARLIQGHRAAVENQLHWVKDVVYNEDASLIQSPRPATLMALWRSWAISAFRKAGHTSITKAIRLFSHDLPKLISFL